MAGNIAKCRLIDYTIFKDGTQRLGTADVTLPDIEYLADSIKGPGIAGEVNMPTLGMTGAMPMTINWRTISADLTELTAPVAHDLEIRGAQQVYDSANGRIKVQPVVVNVRALPTKGSLGKLEISSTTDSANELECVYLKITIDGELKVEIDKFARVFTINGSNYLDAVKSALGL